MGRRLGSENTPWQKIIGIAAAASAAVSLVLLAFIWPTVTAKVKHVPVTIVGNAAQTETLSKTLNAQQSDLFEVSVVPSRNDAVQRIKTRQAYGAIIPGVVPEILTASANGPAVSQIFAQIAQQTQIQRIEASKMLGKPIPPVKVTDIVPLSKHDERGTVLAAMGFPLAIGGMIGGVLISLLVVGSLRRLFGAVAYATIAGFALVGILQGWLGVLPGNFWMNSAAVGLTLLGTSSSIVGLHSLIGRPGIGVGALLTIFIGNPLSGSTQPMQFLLEPWGAVGQWLVPGAGGTLLRSVAYFPNASITFPLYVLLGWIAAGCFFIALGHFRGSSMGRPIRSSTAKGIASLR